MWLDFSGARKEECIPDLSLSLMTTVAGSPTVTPGEEDDRVMVNSSLGSTISSSTMLIGIVFGPVSPG